MKKKKRLNKKLIYIFMIGVLLFIALGFFWSFISPKNNIDVYSVDGLSIQHQLLTPNPYSRAQKPLNKVKDIVVHYTANPNSTAQNNRDYFENLKTKKTTSVSSHFIIGLKGEIIQCVPLNETSYASNYRNKDTISIECCHPDKSGKFTKETYQSLQKLVRALIDTYSLDKDNVIRHYDITQKACPKYFVDNPKQWQEFLNSL